MQWDVFISYASEDRRVVAEPLMEMLSGRGVEVWFDRYECEPGENLPSQVTGGLNGTDAAILIVSKYYLEHGRWAERELDALIEQHRGLAKPLIPIWHCVTEKMVRERSPDLADLCAFNTQDGLKDIADTILARYVNGRKWDSADPRAMDRLAIDFVSGIRQRKWEGHSFDQEIGVQTMERIRSLLVAEDTDFLMSLLNSGTESETNRSRAASLLFGPRLKGNKEEFKRVASLSRKFYARNAGADNWRVVFDLALALADQTNDATAMKDWLPRLRRDPRLLEVNLQDTDSYYGGKLAAISHFTNRVRNKYRNKPAGRFWEVFYLGRRARPGNEDVIAALQECSSTQYTALRKLCIESLGLLAPIVRAGK